MCGGSGLQKEYYTVLTPAVTEFEEKKSRFISSVQPVSSEDEAVKFIQSLKTKYWDATHNVYAYYICEDNEIQRFNDDGEPSGTAGMPILEVIKRMDVRNLVVVVTRYFGGILLGAAGLVRAYSKSAAMGIEAATIVKRVLCTGVQIVIEYSQLGKVQNALLSEGYFIRDIKYGQDVEFLAYVPVDRVNTFTTMMNEVTSGGALMDFGERVYVTLDKNGKPLFD